MLCKLKWLSYHERDISSDSAVPSPPLPLPVPMA